MADPEQMSAPGPLRPMVQLHGVTKRWGTFIAVDQVDLVIRPGEFLTLLGPSGCGKTTLLRMIGGFEAPTTGRVMLDGRDVTRVPPYRREVNQVFQSYALFPHLSVRENVAFGLRMKKVPAIELRQRCDEAIALVALGGMEDRRPHQLSGGQRQRVALARTIVNRPKVLLLDEPLSALDAKLRHGMRGELKRLQNQLGMTFVFVTHDQEEALAMSDRIAVVHHGRIEQLATPAEIYNHPKTGFVADFVGLANILPGEITGCAGGAVQVRLSEQLTLACRGEGPTSPVASASVVRLNIRPEKIRLAVDRPAGENVFSTTVEQELFKGPTREWVLRTSEGLKLIALATSEIAAPVLHSGDRVWVQIRREDIGLLIAD